ncbi:hypothetical protein SmJEL517_g05444 [Synchytrium microbalum]|uniref:Homeobox domain-containing protein n=1 Tax=Synchytrium microbalum TaxID=1806994 RepID=A0A507C0N6_9FUNG|nr:uncharacterized protein SmJEL517_g05444 [Synchytrium microbalum]TPX31135.1 hypothetical protein SmJEL517_g05444 [Synchytrium microbalum]
MSASSSSSDNYGLLSLSPEPAANPLTQIMQNRASPAYSVASNQMSININYQPQPLVTIHKNWMPSIQNSLIPLVFEYDQEHQQILNKADNQIEKASNPSHSDDVNVYLVAARDVLTKQIEYYERSLNVLAPTSSNGVRPHVVQPQHQEHDDDDEDDSEAISVMKRGPKKAKPPQQSNARGISRTPRAHNSTRHDSEQVQILLDSYNHKQYLTPTERVRLSSETGLTQKQVVAWFTNKRSRDPSRSQGETVQDRYSGAVPSSKRASRRRVSLAEEDGLSEDEETAEEDSSN